MNQLVLLFLSIIVLAGCSEPPPTEPPVDSTSTVQYRIVARNVIPLRSGEYYSLWVREAPDSLYRFISDSVLHVYYPFDSAQYFGKFEVKHSLDSLKEILLTIEQTKKPITPGQVVLRGDIERMYNPLLKKDSIFSNLFNSTFDSMTSTTGMLTFTSTSSDPDAYKKEFYFLRFAGPTYLPSIESLPKPPTGWDYAVWTYDVSFNPAHQFLYGLFTDAFGHDSDSTGDAYGFPGGTKQQRQDVGSGVIIITLEPKLYGENLRFAGPSPYRILQFERRRFIIKDQQYPVMNIAEYSFPVMSISFSVRK